MISSLILMAAGACAAADVNQPYEAMQRGFAERSPDIVATAYHPETVIGGVNPPRVRTAEELPSLFGYVAPDDGGTLVLDFRILERDVGDGLAVDVGLYRITSEDRPANYGRFTTVLQCGNDQTWRFVADLMSPASEEDWTQSACSDGAPCAQ